MAITVTDLGEAEDTGSTSAVDFSFASFGTAASDRRLVALACLRDSAINYTANSANFSGTSAVIHVDGGASTVATSAIIFSAMVSTGASGTASMTMSEGISQDQLCTLAELHGTVSDAAAYDSDVQQSAATGTSISGTVDVPAGGVVLACMASTNSVTVTSWSLANTLLSSLVNSDGTMRASSAYEVFASAQTGLTVTANFASTNNARTLAIVSFAPAAYSLAMESGSFALTGGATGLLAGRKLVQSGGSFSLTGGDTTFRKGFTMVAAGGSYSLTGGDATFPLTRKLAMAGGSFSLTGGDTGLLAGRKIVATGGLFSLTGGDAALTAQRVLAAAGGSFALAGGDAALRKGFTLSMLGGSFDLAGGDIDFIYVPTTPDSPVGGHFGGAYVPRKKKWRKVESLEALDQAIRETMRPDLIVLKDGTVIPVNAIELDDEEILLLL